MREADTMIRTVVAGLDGSPGSLAAADWAAREAVSRGLPLRLVHAWEWQPSSHAVRTPPADPDPQRRWAERIPREAMATLRRGYPELPITVGQVAGRPTPALLSAAEGAELLVLGSRGMGAVAGFLLGSVALAVVAATTRPVVLVRAPEPAVDEWSPEFADRPSEGLGCPDVVLGLDLESANEAVIGFAFDAAVRRSAALRVIHGWNPPAIYGYAPAAGYPDVGVELAADEETALKETLRSWREKFPDVKVTAQARVGSAAHHLVEAASSASLLVVGRRTRGSSIGSHIGSVTHAALHHAKCPVAVVPHD